MSAAEPAIERPQGPRHSYVLFSVADGTYALPSDAIVQLAMVGDVTPVPNAPAHVAGVTSIRGRVVPVVDLRRLFGFEPVAPGRRTRLILVAHGGREVALQVDGAREFTQLADEAVQPLRGVAQDIGGEFVRGMAQVEERLIMVLDLGSMVGQETVRPKLSAGAPAGGSHDAILVQRSER
jgi:purine-binding chemotaxis protein CheW